jgi:hypothetical protein
MLIIQAGCARLNLWKVVHVSSGRKNGSRTGGQQWVASPAGTVYSREWVERLVTGNHSPSSPVLPPTGLKELRPEVFFVEPSR